MLRLDVVYNKKDLLKIMKEKKTRCLFLKKENGSLVKVSVDFITFSDAPRIEFYEKDGRIVSVGRN